MLKEDRFTLVMFDPHRHYLHWLVVDIVASVLAAGGVAVEGNEILAYTPPVASEPGHDVTCVIMLLRQPTIVGSMNDDDDNSSIDSEISKFYRSSNHAFRSRHCRGYCRQR